MTPLAIDVKMGLSYLYNYVDEYGLLANDGGAKEYYQRQKEANKVSFYEIQGNDAFLMDAKAARSSNSKKVAKVNLKGVMMAEGGLCHDGIDTTCNELLSVAQNPNVDAIILNTHCGGGQVYAAQRLSNAMTQARKLKPIVQFVDGMSASGAVWAGVLSNEIVLGGNVAETGSIGVVVQYDKQMIDYINENVVSVYADGSEGKHDDLKAILRGDTDYLKQTSLNPVRKEFHSLVKRNRPSVSDEALTGRMFIGRDAKKHGLVDHVGGFDLAMSRAITLSRRFARSQNSKKAQILI